MSTSEKPPGCEHTLTDQPSMYSHPIPGHFISLEMDSPAAVSNAHFGHDSVGAVPDPLAVVPIDLDGPNSTAINNHMHQFLSESVSDFDHGTNILNGDDSPSFAESSEDAHHYPQSFHNSPPLLVTVPDIPGSLGDFKLAGISGHALATSPVMRSTENTIQASRSIVHDVHPTMQRIVQQVTEQSPFEMARPIVPGLENYIRAPSEPAQQTITQAIPTAPLNFLNVSAQGAADVVQDAGINPYFPNNVPLRSYSTSPMQPIHCSEIAAPSHMSGIQSLELAAREASTHAMMADEQVTQGRNVYTFGMYSAGVVHAPGMPARRLDGSTVAQSVEGNVAAAVSGNAARARDVRVNGGVRKTRRSRGKRPKAQTASRFCHICLRRGERVGLLKCSNLEKGTCRKVTCEKCFVEYGWDWHAACSDPKWSCCHCRNACPDRAQCFIYKRTNDRRHQALMQRKAQEAARKTVVNDEFVSCGQMGHIGSR